MLEALKYLIIHYGYIAILIGTFFESEFTVLVLGGLVARLGYLDLPLVILFSYCGVFGGDQCYFLLGRWRGRDLSSRYPRWGRFVAGVENKLGRQRAFKILIFRFLLGLRFLAPLMAGMSGASYPRFLVLDLLSLIPWTLGLCYGGYQMGKLVERYLAHITHYQLIMLGLIILIYLFVWSYFLFYRWLRSPGP